MNRTQRARGARPSRCDGFTLVEMIVAITIYGIVLAAGIGFVAMQNSLFHRGLDRMTALQNLRYALSSLQTDIPTLGTNVPTSQPALVYAGDDVLAFSSDYASNVADDIFATYVDPGAPNGQVTAPDPGVTIPNSGGYTWPATPYRSRVGTRSPAELLIYWFTPDVSTARADDFVLFRQVNAGAPEPVARNILQDGVAPFFQYLRRTTVSGQPSITIVPNAALPVVHTSTFHRVAADTAVSAVADSIRAVRVRFRSTNGLTGTAERVVAASRVIDMPNAGFTLLPTCGHEPIMGGGLGAQLVDLGSGDYVARLAWSAAVDETAGERDVARYVVYRQAVPVGSDWGDPYVSIPAGLATYSFDDRMVALGATYQYALAAQDCTPALSSLETSPLVVVPAS
jgi:prepilin-type N-terminal cleavage/methylation domain-containing protein